MEIKTCSKCGARWIAGHLYWSSGKPGKEEDLAGLVCNKVSDENCINQKLGDNTGQTWEKRLINYEEFLDMLTTFMDDMLKLVENRLLLFDPIVPHHSTTCSDDKCRVNINFNFF